MIYCIKKSLLIYILISISFHSNGQIDMEFVYKEIPEGFIFETFNPEVIKENNGINGISKKNSVKENTALLQVYINENKIIVLPDMPIIISVEGLTIPANRKLIFQKNTTLQIEDNDLAEYQLLRVHDVSNVQILNARLLGDRQGHFGTTGEWGHGISIRGSSNIYIIHFHISDFWGDGIYIGRMGDTPSTNINIKNGICDNNRRNGISLTSGKGIAILNTTVSNSNGTLPMYGVDIEPNTNIDYIENVKISKLRSFNNQEGGLLISLNKLKGNDNKNVSIIINDFIDRDSSIGLRIGQIQQNTNINAQTEIKGITLDNNRDRPIRINSIRNPNIIFVMSGLKILNPKNRYHNYTEYERVLSNNENIRLINE